MDSNSLQKILLMAYIIDNKAIHLILWSHTKGDFEYIFVGSYNNLRIYIIRNNLTSRYHLKKARYIQLKLSFSLWSKRGMTDNVFYILARW